MFLPADVIISIKVDSITSFTLVVKSFLISQLTRRLRRRSLRLPTRRKWAQSGYLGTTAQAGADADISLP